MLKKALCLIFAFLLSINSFAAIVSDNDGSAFVTKAEFKALKDNFVNHYKTSSFQSKTDKNLFDTVKSTTYKSEYGTLFAANRQNTGEYWLEKSITWQVSDSDTYLPSAGFVGLISAWYLYLFKNRIKKLFRDKDWDIEPSTLDDKNLVKFKDGDVEKKFFTTKDRKGKVEFEMKEDFMIYVKAVPHYDTSAAYNGINDWWDLYLNIDGDNGTFTVVYE